MTFLTIFSSACPLILCSFGALCSEYAGSLALFIEGLICFSGFLAYTFTVFTGSPFLGCMLAVISSILIIMIFSLLIEKCSGNKFIAGLALNLLFAALTSVFSSIIFGTQGVLTNPKFSFNVTTVKIISIVVTILISGTTIFFLSFTKPGIYLRITGSDNNVLVAKGVKTDFYRIFSWCATAFFSSIAGCLLVFRISSFVPNISSGRGWMALAAVYIGKEKPWKIILAVIIFCAVDILASNLQNFIPSIPSSILLALPYLIMLLMILY